MDNKFIVKGATIKVLLPTVKGVSKSTGNPYVIKEVVVTLPGEEQYPKELVLKTMSQELIDKLEFLGVGGIIPELEFDPSAREYNGRWYGENKLWRIGMENVQPQPTSVPAQQAPTPTPTQWSRTLGSAQQNHDDGLPF